MLFRFIRYGLIVVLINPCLQANAQLTDNTPTFREMASQRYFRIHYDNDFFTKTDYYYSQGINLEFVHPALKKNPITKILINTRGSDPVYGISFDLSAYTPTSIQSDEILYGDRPFAASISFKTFLIGSDSIRQHRLTSALIIGVLGPAAQGKQIQTSIHRWLNNQLPKGWQNQVQNDILLNYQLNYEQKLFTAKDYFLLNVTGEARLGTVNDKISSGLNFMAGHFNDPYRPAMSTKKKLTCYLYIQSRISLIGYDATLQGGLINRKSPYTISAGDLSRFTFQADGGLVVHFKKIDLSYSQSFLSKEFRTGLYHRWGGVSIGFSL